MTKYALAVAAVVGAELDPAGIDGARGGVADVAGGGGDLLGQLEAAPEIAAGAPRDEADLRGRAGPRGQHAVRHFGDRSVAAEGQDQPPAGGGFPRGDGGRVARRGRERGVQLAEAVGERATQARPAALGEASAGARVDDDERAAAIRQATAF